MMTQFEASVRRALQVVIALVLSIYGQAAAGAFDDPQNALLFSAGSLSGPVAETEPTLAGETYLRSRNVTIDFDMLARAKGSTVDGPASFRLPLNLFDDASVIGIVERSAPTFSGGYSLSGRIADHPLSSMTLVVNGDIVAGKVEVHGRVFRIDMSGDGRYAVSEIDLSSLSFDCEVLE